MERDDTCSDERLQFIYVLVRTKDPNKLVYFKNTQLKMFVLTGMENETEVLTIGRIKNSTLLISGVPWEQLHTL